MSAEEHSRVALACVQTQTLTATGVRLRDLLERDGKLLLTDYLPVRVTPNQGALLIYGIKEGTQLECCHPDVTCVVKNNRLKYTFPPDPTVDDHDIACYDTGFYVKAADLEGDRIAFNEMFTATNVVYLDKYYMKLPFNYVVYSMTCKGVRGQLLNTFLYCTGHNGKPGPINYTYDEHSNRITFGDNGVRPFTSAHTSYLPEDKAKQCLHFSRTVDLFLVSDKELTIHWIAQGHNVVELDLTTEQHRLAFRR